MEWPDPSLDVKPVQMESPTYSVMNRPGFGRYGCHISLLVNHFKVSIKAPEKIFYQYSVKIISEDGQAVKNKAVCRKIINLLHLTYSSLLFAKYFAYDGEQILYTVDPLPRNIIELEVPLEKSFARRNIADQPSKKAKQSIMSKVFKVEISFSRKFPLQPLVVDQSSESEGTQDVLRILDTILRHQAANRGCLVVRQSYFKDNLQDLIDIGGGVSALQGFHSSFHMTKAGLSLNLDVAATLILKPGPVLDFLLANQRVEDFRQIDWEQARKMLKNLRIRTHHTNMEFKIFSLSVKKCHQQRFSMRIKNDNNLEEEQTMEITVSDYFNKYHAIELSHSKYMPCLDVGKRERPIYLPFEVCSLVSLQRYKKALSPVQKSSLVEKLKQRPQQSSKSITDDVRDCNYDGEPLFSACGLSIQKEFTQVDGRVLEAPKLKGGNGGDIIPSNGRWSFNNKVHLLSPVKIECWATVNFSSHCDTSEFCRRLISCGRTKGMDIDKPFALIEEDQRLRKASSIVRVDEMFKKLTGKLPGEPQFILCVLPERRSCDLYAPWKYRSLTKYGVITQCVAPTKITDRYLTNLLLKINVKLGGTNSLLALERAPGIPLIHNTPTMIVGMDVSHGSAAQSDTPSIAAVVGSLFWPHISRYRASVRAQAPKSEIINSLFKPSASADSDDGIMRELLKDFYSTSNGLKPKQIVIFRDGVGESQFGEVLNVELEQVKQAYYGLGEVELPKFTVIVAQKKHQTKLFTAGSLENVPPGTVVDTDIVHPTNYDFYLCAHGGMIGTLRPTHYHVLLDEIGFSPDQLQNFINSLSYVNQRSTFAVSVVAPIFYAHLAAAQVGQFTKVEGFADSVTGPEGVSSPPACVQLHELPNLHKNVCDFMYFC